MTDSDPNSSSPSLLSAWVAGGLLVVVGLQVFASWETRSLIGTMEANAAALEKAQLQTRDVAQQVENLQARVERVQIVADEWEFLVDDVQKLSGQMRDLITGLEGRDGVAFGEPGQPPDLDWTEPALHEAALRGAESVGIELTDDEVRVPARLLLKQGILEYFAVLKGGKEHEALVSLVGNLAPEERRPKDFGVKLNNAIQALGVKRGKSIRFTPNGTRPAVGQTVYLFIEWEEAGETVVVRAEDLIWDRMRDTQMPSDTWVFVGSSFVEGDEPGELLFAADLTAEAVATYSAVNTIIDNIAPGAQDDTVFVVATPRVPDNVQDVTLVVRVVDREPTRTFETPFVEGDRE
jgi:hypothetical protein